MENLKNQIKEYQQKYGDRIQNRKGLGALYDWEFNLMRDLGAITIKNEGDPYKVIIRIVGNIYLKYKKQREEIKNQRKKQQYAIKMNIPSDITNIETIEF